MKKLILPLLVSLLFTSVFAAPQQTRCFELRTYYAAPGKLDDLNARFRNHTLKLFEKHGMANLGYWLPLDNPDQKIIYLLGYPSREAASKSWKDFFADPQWKEVVKQTEANGRLITNVVSIFLATTDFSPVVTPSSTAEPRLFELRTYKTEPGRFAALLARFRDHTVSLFKKHGLEQFGYWVPLDADKGADNTLIYLLIHKNKEAADANWKAFRADTVWIAAKKASEDKAGGSLTLPNGVTSVYMKATDYSPTK